MDKEIQELKNQFQEIVNMGWIESSGSGKGAIGITFEKLLNIDSNELEIPDYRTVIELKTKASHFNDIYPITLFSATCDGKYLFELQRIKDTYGTYLSNYKSRVLFLSLFGNEYTNLSKSKKAKLDVDYKEQKIYFLITDYNNKIIERQAYWTFDMLREKIERKLKLLAFIQTDRKLVNGKLYFKYNTLEIYEFFFFNHICLLNL